ncbi:hypothetical protein [Corynebacterium casei]|uniref:Uncharacterized protein n=1 Tax=Corynebacterium casei LMG S-19264 TaxID=1285583 RepID=A0ABM5PNM6_9CORY|nr:hypothetical protein [Corynebacterium casei]AHI19543.1 hypothetical protein CCASEI_04825 [Corynebacterium casei LMG S-19264]
MFLDEAIVINDHQPEDGVYRIGGWINCPPESRVILRFVTKGTQRDQVDGLHWAATGGWYKYLPASGNRDRFEIEAYFDKEIHGTPEVRIERWYGNGDIELLLDRPGWQPLAAFWGSDQAYSDFSNNTLGIIKRVSYSSCLVTAGEPSNQDLINRLHASNKSIEKFPELHADLERRIIKTLATTDFDALVIDLESLCVPISNVEGTYIEVSPEARSLGSLVMESDVVKVGDGEYFRVLKNSLDSLLQSLRPRPILIQLRESDAELSCAEPGSDEKFNSTIQNLMLEESGFEFLRIPGRSSGGSLSAKKIELENLIEPYWTTFDENMTLREKPSQLNLVSNLTPLDAVQTAPVKGLFNSFRVEVDVLVSPKQYKDRNLLLTLEIEDQEGNPLNESLSRYSVSRSAMPGIDYFMYFPEIRGSETVTFEVNLPEYAKCRAIGVQQIRDIGSVFISRFAIQSDHLLNYEMPSEEPKKEKEKLWQ